MNGSQKSHHGPPWMSHQSTSLTSLTLGQRPGLLWAFLGRSTASPHRIVVRVLSHGSPGRQERWMSMLIHVNPICDICVLMDPDPLMIAYTNHSSCRWFSVDVDSLIVTSSVHGIEKWWDLHEFRVWIKLPLCLHSFLVGGLEHFFIFPYIGNNHPNWLIFFRGVQTTNQVLLADESDHSEVWSALTWTEFRGPGWTDRGADSDAWWRQSLTLSPLLEINMNSWDLEWSRWWNFRKVIWSFPARKNGIKHDKTPNRIAGWLENPHKFKDDTKRVVAPWQHLGWKPQVRKHSKGSKGHRREGMTEKSMGVPHWKTGSGWIWNCFGHFLVPSGEVFGSPRIS